MIIATQVARSGAILGCVTSKLGSMRQLIRVITALFLVLSMLALPTILALPVAPTVWAQGIPAPMPPGDGQLARVVAVTDGDTIKVDLGAGVIERLRYIGIDTPETVHPSEPVEPWGPEASAANAALVAGREVLLERDVSERDRYDRLLRYVWVEQADGWHMVNAELVALGLAEVRAYEPDTRHDAWLRQVEDEAKAAGLGMHGRADTTPAPTQEPGLIESIFDLLFGG